MASIDDLYQEMIDKGYDPDDINRIRAANDASGLRKDLKDAREEAKAARERAKKYEEAALAAKLRDRGVKVKPSAIVRPEDLDISDDEAVNKWLTDVGLYEPAPAASAEELQAHDRAANLAAGEPAPKTPLDEKKARLVAGNLTEDEFWATANELNLTTK